MRKWFDDLRMRVLKYNKENLKGLRKKTVCATALIPFLIKNSP